MESKAFSTAALASLSSGVLLCNFSEMHEAAEYLLGHPVWTHELAYKPTWDKMKDALRAQHPALPFDKEDVDKDHWQEFRDQLIAQLGAELVVTKGSAERTSDPITTAREMLGPDKQIIAI